MNKKISLIILAVFIGTSAFSQEALRGELLTGVFETHDSSYFNALVLSEDIPITYNNGGWKIDTNYTYDTVALYEKLGAYWLDKKGQPTTLSDYTLRMNLDAQIPGMGPQGQGFDFSNMEFGRNTLQIPNAVPVYRITNGIGIELTSYFVSLASFSHNSSASNPVINLSISKVCDDQTIKVLWNIN